MSKPKAQDSATRQILSFDRSSINFLDGLRAGVLAAFPLLIAILTKNLAFVSMNLGAAFLTMAEGSNSSRLSLAPLLAACIIEPIAYFLGTLTALTGVIALPILGLGVFLSLLLGQDGSWGLVGATTAMIFAAGVGLPGATVPVALSRLIFAFAGALIAFIGIWAYRYFTDRSHAGFEFKLPKITVHSDIFRDFIAIGIASAVGFGIGIALGLPRDFWIVITIIMVSRPRINPTAIFTLLMVIGTVIGAVLAEAILVGVTNAYVLWLILLVFGVLLFATRGVNLGLTQVFMVPFIILIVDDLYHHQLAVFRIIDVALGGAIAMVTILIAHELWRWHSARITERTSNHHPASNSPIASACPSRGFISLMGPKLRNFCQTQNLLKTASDLQDTKSSIYQLPF